jgi:hypothetical protein
MRPTSRNSSSVGALISPPATAVPAAKVAAAEVAAAEVAAEGAAEAGQQQEGGVFLPSLFRDLSEDGVGANADVYHDARKASRKHFDVPDNARAAMQTPGRAAPDPLHLPTHGVEAWKKGKAVGLRTFHGNKVVTGRPQSTSLSGIGCLNQHLGGEV